MFFLSLVFPCYYFRIIFRGINPRIFFLFFFPFNFNSPLALVLFSDVSGFLYTSCVCCARRIQYDGIMPWHCIAYSLYSITLQCRGFVITKLVPGISP